MIYHKFVQISKFHNKKVMLGKNFGLHEYVQRGIGFYFRVKNKKDSKSNRKMVITRHTETFYVNQTDTNR